MSTAERQLRTEAERASSGPRQCSQQVAHLGSGIGWFFAREGATKGPHPRAFPPLVVWKELRAAMCERPEEASTARACSALPCLLPVSRPSTALPVRGFPFRRVVPLWREPEPHGWEREASPRRPGSVTFETSIARATAATLMPIMAVSLLRGESRILAKRLPCACILVFSAPCCRTPRAGTGGRERFYSSDSVADWNSVNGISAPAIKYERLLFGAI
jgi:hypothetical protein